MNKHIPFIAIATFLIACIMVFLLSSICQTPQYKGNNTEICLPVPRWKLLIYTISGFKQENKIDPTYFLTHTVGNIKDPYVGQKTYMFYTNGTIRMEKTLNKTVSVQNIQINPSKIQELESYVDMTDVPALQNTYQCTPYPTCIAVGSSPSIITFSKSKPSKTVLINGEIKYLDIPQSLRNILNTLIEIESNENAMK